ncbi:hypothetical protein Tco_1390673, partial [Tanacetum coccineum]
MATPPEKEIESRHHQPMSDEVKYNIVRSIGEECIQEEDLKESSCKKAKPNLL